MPPFEILRPLGKGAMGAVYEVRVEGDPRRLVAKLLTSIRPNALERFRREGELAARLGGHPGIVGVHSHGVLENGTPYLIFDLVEGNSLFGLLRQAGKLPLDRVVAIGRELAAALGHAHAHGIVHRDVKPENLLIDTQGRLRLTDFGLGLAADQLRLTRTDVAVGTPLYMAPEQVRGKKGNVGPWTDVHAAGLVLAECLTGRAVFYGESSRELASNVVKLVPSRLKVSPGIDAVVARCLEKNPEDRYANGAELEKDLARLAAGQAPEALGQQRTRTWLLAGIGACALLAGASIVTGLALRSGGSEVQAAKAEAKRGAEETLTAALEALRSASRMPVDARAEALAEHRGELSAARAALEGVSDGARPGDAALRGRLLALESEAALLAGDLSAARAALEALSPRAEGPADSEAAPEESAARAAHLSALRAGLVALNPVDAADSNPALEALAAAQKRWPRRAFGEWRVLLALRVGDHASAAGALTGLDDPTVLPMVVRFQVFVGSGQLERAESLAAEVAEPKLLGWFYYRLALRDLESSDLFPREHARRALRDAPEHPLKAELLARAHEVLRQRSAWDPDGYSGAELDRLLRWEVDAHRLVQVVEPGATMERERAGQLQGAAREFLDRNGVEGLDTMADLVFLNPGYEPFADIYLRLAAKLEYPNPEQGLRVVRCEWEHAEGERRYGVMVRYVMALRMLRRLEPFPEILERAKREGVKPSGLSLIHSVWGDTLRILKRPQEALATLERAIALNPDSPWPHSHLFRLQRDAGQLELAEHHAWAFLDRLRVNNRGWVRMEQERTTEIVAWFESRGELDDKVRALQAHMDVQRDAIHAASRCARLLCGAGRATPGDLQRVADCIRARARRVKSYARSARLPKAKVQPMLDRLEQYHVFLTKTLPPRLVTDPSGVSEALERMERALPVE